MVVTRLQQTQDSILANVKNATQDRAATEEALQEAAIRLLDQHGVLAGLNLREVAAEAGVNRGLVYHYFGSRAALLRRALRKTARARIGEIASARDMPFRQRMVHYWRTIVGYPREIRLVTLLLLDSRDAVFKGGEGVQLTPVRGETLKAMDKDKNAGAIGADVDLDGLHAAIVAMASGYSVFRKELARGAKLPVTVLDQKVESVFERMLDGLTEHPRAGERNPD